MKDQGTSRGARASIVWITALGLASGAACGDDGATPGTDGSSGAGTTGLDSSDDAVASTGPATSTDDDTRGDSESSTGEPADPGPRSLVVAIDGLRADALVAADTPHVDALIDGSWQPGYAGAFAADAQCLTDAPSYSGPNHWAIMTGAIGVQHGVVGNLDVASGDGVNFPHYLSLLERTDPTMATAYLFTWVSDVDIPCEADYIRDADDQSNVERVVAILGQTFDDADGQLGTQWSAGTSPDAIFLFLDDVDHAGHMSGFDPLVPEYIAAIEEIDGQLGQILDALAARPSFEVEAWQIVVTTDHGGTGLGHGGDSPEELTIPFLVTSQDVAPGVLPPGIEAAGTRNFDTTPTVLDHMGVEIPPALTGTSRAFGPP